MSAVQHPLPWVLPGTLLFAVIGIFLSRPLARRLGTNALVAWLLIVSVAVIVFATLMPLYGELEPSATGPGRCDLSVLSPIPLGELLHRTDRTLNVLLFFPLGMALGLLPRSRLKAGLLIAAVALPFVIESTQLLLPILNRACQSSDVIDNVTGLVIGLGFGLLLGTTFNRLFPAEAVPGRTTDGGPAQLDR